MKKILFLTKGSLPFPPVKGGAVETLLYNLVKENEQKRLFEFTIISTVLPSNIELEQFEFTKVVYTHSKTNMFKYGSYFIKDRTAKIVDKIFGKKIFVDKFPHIFKKSLDMLARENYDLVIDLNCVDRVRKMKEATNSKVAIYLHNDYINNNLWKAKSVIKSTDIIFTVSDFLRKNILKVSENGNVHKISNGITRTTTLNLTRNQKKDLRNQWGVAPNDYILLFCGRIHETKGPHRILEAIKKIQFEKNVHIFFVGGITHGSASQNSYSKYLDRLAEKSKAKTHFTGHLSQQKIGELLSIADLSIAPSSFNETCCLSMVEAQQAGVPTIVTDIGGTSEYFIPGGGYMLDKNNITEDLVTAIKTCLKDEQQEVMRKKLSEFSDEYSVRKMYQEFEHAVSKII
ncbi:glycosyltransferase family 4 protein [Enterococcus faecalis]|uniref:glycosyltransferase family 4 protein n=1 Tax=Enterococcus faecalis TaxID=1351 RepID=UPI002DC02D0D|nr:glycosyltransferase family 4 protein [Enterococcus faecalis]MEB7428090.1 glycosyltransferase family 4 protein [Enterococcus faecalis]